MQFKTFTDQLSRPVEVQYPPKRIISLVPSQTELLFSLGLDEEVVGITKFCIHPKNRFRSKPKIGGTKMLNLEAIRTLRPDLIIGNKEENERGQIEQLMQEFPVWMSDINNLEDALQMIRQVGEICGRTSEAVGLGEKIGAGFEALATSSGKMLRVAYLIWKDPYMLAGKGTFIDDMLNLGGWKNAIDIERYPVLTSEQLAEAHPDIIFLSSEPYPFSEKHIDEFRPICPGAAVFVVDGEMFSWYGSRLQFAPEYLYSLKQQTDSVNS
ncbi:MAG: cobalamin-binding protein [Sphingobacteriaceae bacterium]|jgi:ABC-type Fe3+-hydroxamate transport system substrate-binding protein|nr:cobalamin-binding protein [Sphingobacteriaceae bacterium]